MTTPHVPSAIRDFIDATNNADSDAFVAAFTEDAHLNDWGREFHGHEGIRAWNSTDNIGVRAHFELLAIEPGDDPDSVVATIKVTSDRFNGTGPMTFRLRDDRIADLNLS